MIRMVVRGRILLSLAALALLILCATQSASAQFSLPKQSRAIFSGQLIDAKTGEPLSEATVFIRTEYGDSQAKTDAVGNFLLEVDDDKGLKKFLIIFSHPDYREKDLSTLFKETFHGSAHLQLHGEDKSSAATIKYKKNNLSLSCGNDIVVTAKERQSINFGLNCQSGTRTLSVTLSRGNTFAVSGASDIDIEINNEKTKIAYARDEPVRIEIKALMFRR